MYIGLDSYGNYDIFKNEKEMTSQRNKYKYCIFDCSSTLKGPLHTIVKSQDIKSLPESLKVEITISEQDPECKPTKIFSKKMEFEVQSLTELYTIVTNCYMYEDFNSYVGESSYEFGGYSLQIDEIKIYYQKSESSDTQVFHYYYDTPCDFMSRFFKSISINTATFKAFKEEFLILDKNGHYYFTDEIPDKFEYIGIHIERSHGFYLLSYKKFKRFDKIDMIEVSIGNRDYSLKENDYVITESMQFYISNAGLNYYNDFYRGLLYVPQYIILHYDLLDSSTIVSINVTIDDSSINVIADYKDIQERGISLFKIIDAVTKI